MSVGKLENITYQLGVQVMTKGDKVENRILVTIEINLINFTIASNTILSASC